MREYVYGCPKCGRNNYYKGEGYKTFKCRDCGHIFKNPVKINQLTHAYENRNKSKSVKTKLIISASITLAIVLLLGAGIIFKNAIPFIILGGLLIVPILINNFNKPSRKRRIHF